MPEKEPRIRLAAARAQLVEHPAQPARLEEPPFREAPVAVEIITGEDIRASGAVDLWDYLRFRAGMNVVDGRSGEGNRALVSIRGFPAEFVDNMLVLLDGRSVYTGLSGGAVWEALPVQAQDIDRIEIVRGPNAALYGSNAGLGVVNIITRRPAARRSVSGEALGGNEGLHREQVSFEDGGKAGAYRLSAAHKERRGFPTTAGAVGQDYLYSQKENFRGLWTPTEDSTFELLAGGSWDDLGVIDPDNPSARFRHHFEMLRHAYDPVPDSSVQTMVARREDLRTYVPRAKVWVVCLHCGRATKGKRGRRFCDTAHRTRYHSSRRWQAAKRARAKAQEKSGR